MNERLLVAVAHSKAAVPLAAIDRMTAFEIAGLGADWLKSTHCGNSNCDTTASWLPLTRIEASGKASGGGPHIGGL
jgi:hypothetical protein